MIDLLCAFRNPEHPIRLNVEFRRDLHWWRTFLAQWNGISFFLSPTVAPLPNLSIASDASGALGFGAFWQSSWFSHSWSFLPRPLSITYRELVPIVVAASLWGPLWCRLRVQFQCDNSAVVAILNKGSSKSSEVMHLLRSLITSACSYNFTFTAVHVPGSRNAAADALSRLQVPEFRRLHPAASPLPTSVPPSLLQSLIPPT